MYPYRENSTVGPESELRRPVCHRPDKTYTLTDCLSFVMMRRLKIETAIATDDHFRQEGFVVAP